MKQIFTNDATIEGLINVLKENKKGIMYSQDELSGWLSGMNQYKNGQGNDMQKWLSFWNNSMHISNRKSDDEISYLKNTFVNVFGGIQLDKLNSFPKANNGLIDRFLPSFPEPMPLAYNRSELDDAILELFSNLILKIWKLAVNENQIIYLKDSSKEIWFQWVDRHVSEANNGDIPYYLIGIWSKFIGYSGRLLLILHIAHAYAHNKDINNIDNEMVNKAIDMIEYFKLNVIKFKIIIFKI